MLQLNLASRSYDGRTLCRLRDGFGAVDAP